MKVRYKSRRHMNKGSVRTYYDDASVIANRSGLTIADMTATSSDPCISVNSQQLATDRDELAYQLRANEAGKSVITITITFGSTAETEVYSYLYTVLDNSISTIGYA